MDSTLKHAHDDDIFADMEVKRVCKNIPDINEQILFAARSNLLSYFQYIVTENNKLKNLRGILGYSAFKESTSETIKQFLLTSDKLVLQGICINAYSNDDVTTLEYIDSNTSVKWHELIVLKSNPPKTLDMLRFMVENEIVFEQWISAYLKFKMYDFVDYIINGSVDLAFQNLIDRTKLSLKFSVDLMKKFIEDAHFTGPQCMKICELYVSKNNWHPVYSYLVLSRDDLSEQDIKTCLSHFSESEYSGIIMRGFFEQENTDAIIKYFKHRVPRTSGCNRLMTLAIIYGNTEIFDVLLDHIKVVKTCKENNDENCAKSHAQL